MYCLREGNFYGLDERALPTKIAYQVRDRLGRPSHYDYILNEQGYPQKR